jgi:Flp pilus assembly protein CpaB
MNRRVLLILVVVLILIAAAAGAALLMGGGGGTEADATPETSTDGTVLDQDGTATAVAGSDLGETPVPASEGPVTLTPVVIALQDLPRGFRLSPEFTSGPSPAVAIAYWPADSFPENGFQSVEEVENYLVRSDIPRESPILATQLVDDMTDLAQVGSDAALLLPPGLVAISMPLDESGVGSVAYGLQPGDFVDVMLTFLFIDVDEIFQSRQPNLISIITRDEEGNLNFGQPIEGRAEPSTLSALGVIVGPSEQQRPRLVTQRTVERAYVVYVGYFPPDGRIVGVMTPTPFLTPTPAEAAEAAPADGSVPTALPPTATPFIPTIVTLGVEPQDALILTWALDSQIPITYALRSANDAGSTPTTAVSLQYLIENYGIPRPPVLDFALEPPIRSLRGAQLDIFTDFGSAEPAEATAPQQ